LSREVEFAPSRPIAGHFNCALSPYIAEPLAIAMSERNRELWLIASWQSAKTLALELAMLWLMVNDGQSAIWNAPTNERAKEFSSTRLSELMDDCAPMRGLLAGDRFSDAKMLKRFVHSSLIIQGVDAIGNVQSKSAGYIFNDEPWLWEPGRIGELRARVTKYARWLIFNATTAGEVYAAVKGRIDENGEMQTVGPDETTQAWEASDQREWHLRCPACRGFFAPTWDDMDLGGNGSKNKEGRFSGDLSRNDSGEFVLAKVRKNLRLICPLCQAAHAPSRVTTEALNDGAHYRVLKPENEGGIIAWHYNAICHYDWLKLAEEWIRAHKALRLGNVGPLKMFVQRRLAETWVPGKFIHSVAELSTGGYKLGEKWPEALHTFLTVDVQKDCFYAVARQWGSGISRQLAVERLLTVDDVEKMRIKWEIPSNWVGIDAGWNMDLVLVYCARFGYAALNGVKRRAFYHAEDNQHRIYSPVRWHNAYLGTKADVGQRVPEFLFSTQAVNDRLDTLRGMTDPTPIWTVAEDCPELYKKHMDACRKREKRNAQGMPYFEWEQIGSRPDHWRDAELMQVVMASMAGLVGAEAAPNDAEEADRAKRE